VRLEPGARRLGPVSLTRVMDAVNAEVHAITPPFRKDWPPSPVMNGLTPRTVPSWSSIRLVGTPVPNWR
jgi:hypothetical protein